MELIKICTSLTLLPAVLAAQDLSPDVKRLLEKPRQGTATVVLRDGTHQHGSIVRVTDRFVSLDASPSCRDVNVSQIGKIDWDKVPRSSGYDDGYWSLLIILWPLLPYYLIEAGINNLDPKRGYWESAPSPDGYIEQLHLSPNENLGHGTVQYRKFTLRTGRYRVDGDRLLTTTSGGDERSAQLRIQCDTLALSGLREPLRAERRTGPAAPPIVGRWSAPDQTREYMPNGTFRIETLAEQFAGNYQKNKDGTTDMPLGGQARQWKIRKTFSSLLVTRDGETVRFKRRKPF